MEDELLKDLHPAKKDRVQTINFELLRPEENGVIAWGAVNSAYQAIGRATQVAIASIATFLRTLRDKGRIRVATRDDRAIEKKKGEFPEESVTPEEENELARIVRAAMKETKLNSRIHDTCSNYIVGTEFKKSRWWEVVNGLRQLPDIRNPQIRFRDGTWKVTKTTVTKKDAQGEKTYENLEFTTCGLRALGPKLKLVCRTVHPSGRGIKAFLAFKARKNIQDTLVELSQGVNHPGWKLAQLSLKRKVIPGQRPMWFVLISYHSPGVEPDVSKKVFSILHRGAANMLTLAVIGEEGKVKTYTYPGTDIVAHKAQMYSRKKILQRSLSATPHNRRGKRAHFYTVTKLRDKEAQYVVTAQWRAAKWAQNIITEERASILVTDDFGEFHSKSPGSDIYLKPYVYNFPYASLKAKMIDVCTRRIGIPVFEQSSAYISQKCPACGCISKDNIRAYPDTRLIVEIEIQGTDKKHYRYLTRDEREGKFQCTNEACGLVEYLDIISIYNLVLDTDRIPKRTRDLVKKNVQKLRILT